MIDLVNFKKNRFNDVVSNEFKSRVSEMVHHILLPSCEKIVNDDDTISSVHQSVNQMTPNKPSSSSYKHSQSFTFQSKRNLSAGAQDSVLVLDAAVGEDGCWI